MDNNENMDNIIPQDGELNNETEKDIFDNQDNNINMDSNDYQENNNIANNEQVQNDNQCNDTIDDLNEEDSKDNDRVTVEPSVKFSAENLLTKLNSDIIAKDKKYNKLKKKNFVLTVILAVLILIFIAVATVIFVFVDHAKLQLNILSNKYNQKNAATSSEIGGLLDYELFMDKLGFIDQYVDLFFYYDKDNKKIEDSMFSGYIKALGDKYAEYMPAKQYDNFIEETSGEYYGIGCQVKTDPNTNDHVVDAVFEG